LLARIIFHSADEIVYSSLTRPQTSTFVRADEIVYSSLIRPTTSTFVCADEIVYSSLTRPITSTFVRAGDVDPRPGRGAVRVAEGPPVALTTDRRNLRPH